MRSTEMEIDGIHVSVVRKRIKSMNLYVKAPDGAVRVSVPERTSERAICAFVREHLDWIMRKQEDMRRRHPARTWTTGETCYVFGEALPLVVQETAQRTACGVEPKEGKLVLTVLKSAAPEKRQEIFRHWQRGQLSELLASFLQKWEPILGVHNTEWHIKRMKTRWGSCNSRAHRVWFGLALAERPVECVEYVVVHELCHLLEPSHSERFWGLMTQFLPDWERRRARLNERQNIL